MLCSPSKRHKYSVLSGEAWEISTRWFLFSSLLDVKLPPKREFLAEKYRGYFKKLFQAWAGAAAPLTSFAGCAWVQISPRIISRGKLPFYRHRPRAILPRKPVESRFQWIQWTFYYWLHQGWDFKPDVGMGRISNFSVFLSRTHLCTVWL